MSYVLKHETGSYYSGLYCHDEKEALDIRNAVVFESEDEAKKLQNILIDGYWVEKGEVKQ